MPQRDVAPNGAPTWVDLLTSDPDKSRAFYAELFGWTSEEPDPMMGGYFNFFKDGVHVAGGMSNDGSAGVPDTWSVYLAVPNAAASAESATAHGGEIVVPAMDIQDIGSMAVVTDAGGARIGMWQAGTHKGFQVMAEPGAPTWFELNARRYDASVTFYRDVFGWDTHVMEDTPEFKYTTFGEGDGALAGVMDASTFLPEGVPANWTIYFGTDDTDKALERIVDLGGTVVQGAEDSPHGRLATAADPTGAVFKLVAVG